MSKIAKANVTVHDDQGASFTFEKGTKVPDWAVEKITNPIVWKGFDEEPSGDELAATASAGSPESDEIVPTEPPKTGKGATDKAWATYAATIGVSLPEGVTKKNDIIAAIAAVKVDLDKSEESDDDENEDEGDES